MDPLTIGLLAAGGLARGIGGAVSTRAAGKAAFGDAQQERLAELRRQEGMNALGLSDVQRQELGRMVLDPVQAASQERLLRQQSLLGSTGAFQSGDALAGLMRQQETEARQMDAASNKLLAADMAMEQRQRAEMNALNAAESANEASKQAAVGAFIAGLGGAADAGLQYQALQDATARRNIDSDAAIDPEVLKLLESF